MQEGVLDSPLYLCLSVNFKRKYFLNVLINLALGSGTSLEWGGGHGGNSFCVAHPPASPLLSWNTRCRPQRPRLGVLHMRGRGEAPGPPEVAHLLWAPRPPNPTEPTPSPQAKPSSRPLACLRSYSHGSSWPAPLQPPRLLRPRPLITQDVIIRLRFD